MNNLLLRQVVCLAIVGSMVMACEPQEPLNAGSGVAESKLRWQHSVNTDPRDGSKSVQIMIGASSRTTARKDPVSLVLSCTGGITDVYVIWRQYLGVYDLEVTWRVGSDEEVRQTWSLSTDNEATFAPQPVELIKRMMINDRFLVKTSPYGSSPVTEEFNTAGLSAEVSELRELCGW